MAIYTKEEQREFREIEDSRIRALVLLMYRNAHMPAVMQRQASPDFAYELAVKKALLRCRLAKASQREGESALNHRFFRYALKEAIKRDDLGFFVSVGRVLSREQITMANYLQSATDCTAFQGFLLNYWCEQIDNETPPLCFLSMKQLCDTCKACLPSNQGLHEKLIHNAWRRMGLKRARGVTFRGPGLHRLRVFRSGCVLKNERGK